MRVTLVTETYFPQVNGVSRTLGQLVGVLKNAGDLVQIVHPNYGVVPDHENVCLVRSIRVPFYPELHMPLPPFGDTLKAIDTFGPDLVHIATEATLGNAVLRHALNRKIPVVSSFHTNFDQYTSHYGVGWVRGLVWKYLRWFHNSTLETYVPSNHAIRLLEDEHFERLVLWPRGVDSTLFRPDRKRRSEIRESLGFGPEHVVIGHVSRIAAEKNVRFLGEALALVATERPNSRLLIVGDGPAKSELEETLGESARFVGYRTGEDLADHYSACDLFAFASLTETFGNVVLEAMSSGLPVIAINAGGPGEIVENDVSGILVQPNTPASKFAGSVIELIDDPRRRARLAAAARHHAERQSWSAIMTTLRDRYRNIVEESSTMPIPRPA